MKDMMKRTTALRKTPLLVFIIFPYSESRGIIVRIKVCPRLCKSKGWVYQALEIWGIVMILSMNYYFGILK